MKTIVEKRRTLAPRDAASLRKRDSIGPLENGMTMTTAEFLRRAETLPPEIKKAELIDGTVYIMFNFVTGTWHGEQDSLLQLWMGTYALETPGVSVYGNSTVCLGPKDAPQPDVLMRVLPEYGGRTHFDNKGYIVGPVEFATEIAASSASIDLGKKLASYRDFGVKEYLAWRTRMDALDWWYLDNGKYVPLLPDKAGIIRSRVFPGLWLDSKALLKRDAKGIMAALKKGIKSPEHAKFVKQLKANKQS